MITSGAQSLTDASGAYEIRGLVAATYRLAVLDRGKPMAMHGGARRPRHGRDRRGREEDRRRFSRSSGRTA